MIAAGFSIIVRLVVRARNLYLEQVSLAGKRQSQSTDEDQQIAFGYLIKSKPFHCLTLSTFLAVS